MEMVLGTEDELSESVGMRLINFYNDDVSVQRLRRGGNGYLRKSLGKFHEIAKRIPVLLITDLDTRPCPKALISEWHQNIAQPQPSLIFRVAVHEVEAWLLGDHDGFSKLLEINPAKLPPNPDVLPDPKAEILKLAQGAKRTVKADLVVERGAAASRGLGYNRVLSEFANQSWSPESAAKRSESLKRAMLRLSALLNSC